MVLRLAAVAPPPSSTMRQIFEVLCSQHLSQAMFLIAPHLLQAPGPQDVVLVVDRDISSAKFLATNIDMQGKFNSTEHCHQREAIKKILEFVAINRHRHILRDY
jgi:hypothetical protein